MAIKQFISSIARKRGIIHFSGIFSQFFFCTLCSSLLHHRSSSTRYFTRLPTTIAIYSNLYTAILFVQKSQENVIYDENLKKKIHFPSSHHFSHSEKNTPLSSLHFTSWWDLIFFMLLFPDSHSILRVQNALVAIFFSKEKNTKKIKGL
jgi:hypothetical protein